MDAANSTTVCANIGPKQRRMRVIFGVTLLLVSAGFAVLFYQVGWVGWPMLALSPLLFFGALGLLQAAFRICVAHDFAGTSNFDTGNAASNLDGQLRLRMRQKSVQIIAFSISFALFIAATLALISQQVLHG